MNRTEGEALLARILALKAEEKKAADERRELEAKWLAFLAEKEQPPVEGVQHFDTPGYRGQVKFSMDYKFIDEDLDAIYVDIPDPVREKLVRIKREVGVTEMKRLKSENQTLYAIVARAISSKPARPYLTIEPKE